MTLIQCKYCDKICKDYNMKQHEPKCHLNPLNIKRCFFCNKILTGLYQKKFCSKSCMAFYTTKGRKHSEETKNKIRESIKKSSPTILTISKWFEYECIICKSKWKILQPEVYSKYTKQTCSKDCHRKLLSIKAIETGCGGYREGAGRSKTGYYKGMFCGSSYELIFVAYHLDIGTDIKRCELKIPYQYENKKHLYHPDFMIDGKIYEMKGFYTEVVDIKTKATINAGYEIDVLYLEELQPMLNYLKEKYKFKNIIDLYE